MTFYSAITIARHQLAADSRFFPPGTPSAQTAYKRSEHPWRFVCRSTDCEARRYYYLNNFKKGSERDHDSFADSWHDIPHEAKHDADGKQCDFQRKLRVAIIPKAKAYLTLIVLDREVRRVRDNLRSEIRPALVIDGQAYHINHGADLAALK